jgi:hypothetical protein
VSVEAISRALSLAPVPADRGGQPSSPCKFVLVGLANHAGPDGTNAFLSVATLVRYTGLSERTVRTCLDRLEDAGIIQAWTRTSSPPGLACRPAPEGLGPDLSLIRADLTDTEVAVLGRQFPGTGARAAAAACPDTREAPDGGQSPHPASAVDNPADRVQLLHPASGTGCNQRTDEVQPVQSRGATAAPEPSKEPYLEPPAAAAGVCEASLASGAVGGGPAGEFFAALGDGWRLTPTQRLKLVPAVTAALERGWAPRVLAAFAGANINGVRNPYAVLTARLSPAGLPPPRRPARPPWCGQCDQTTRMLGFHSDAPRPCPRCKPACTQQDRPSPRRPLPPRSPSRAQASIGTRAAGDRESQPEHRERGQAPPPARPQSPARQ